MKECGRCGEENSDETKECVICHAELNAALSPPLAEGMTGPGVSPAKRHFWEQMTFRQFAIFWLRLQALWLMFYAIVDLTSLPVYFGRMHDFSPYSTGYADASRSLVWQLARIALHVAGAVAIIGNAERLVDWLVRDWTESPQKKFSSD